LNPRGIHFVTELVKKFKQECLFCTERLTIASQPLSYGLQTRSHAASDLGILELLDFPVGKFS
jgi:hypothetical protein